MNAQRLELTGRSNGRRNLYLLLLHGPPIAIAIAISVAASWPGVHFGLIAVASLVFLISLFLWPVLAILLLTKKIPLRARHLVVAPLLAVASLTILFSGSATDARFLIDRSAFEAQIENLQPAGTFDEQVTLDTPSRIGTLPIERATQAGDAVMFHSTDNILMGHAGIAYLPGGPDQRVIATVDKSIEQPRFQSLGGDWYLFSASW